jgi:hypothetical protein
VWRSIEARAEDARLKEVFEDGFIVASERSLPVSEWGAPDNNNNATPARPSANQDIDSPTVFFVVWLTARSRMARAIARSRSPMWRAADLYCNRALERPVRTGWWQRGNTGDGDVDGQSRRCRAISPCSGTTGKIIQDGGKALPAGTVVGTADARR